MWCLFLFPDSPLHNDHAEYHEMPAVPCPGTRIEFDEIVYLCGAAYFYIDTVAQRWVARIQLHPTRQKDAAQSPIDALSLQRDAEPPIDALSLQRDAESQIEKQP